MNPNLLIGVIGPLTTKVPNLQYCDTHEGCIVKTNIDLAAHLCKQLWEHCAVYCPHLNSGPLYGYVPEETAKLGIIETLRRCDAVFMMEGSELSENCMTELSNTMDLPCFTTIEEVETWVSQSQTTVPQTPK